MGTVVAVVESAFVNCLLFAVIACHVIVVVDYFAVKLEVHLGDFQQMKLQLTQAV